MTVYPISFCKDVKVGIFNGVTEAVSSTKDFLHRQKSLLSRAGLASLNSGSVETGGEKQGKGGLTRNKDLLPRCVG